MNSFLHELPDFKDLILVVADQKGIDPSLVEKDYWIMHCLWGLQAQRFRTGDEQVIARNSAFILDDPELLQRFTLEFQKTAGLYYQEQLVFRDLMHRIHQNLDVM